MSSTNKTAYYELSQYIGTDKPTYLGDYNTDMSKIDTAIHGAASDASTAVSTANSAASAATAASTAASTATTTANTAKDTADSAAATAATANTNAAAALTAAQGAETAAAANTITNLAPAYDAVAGTYAVGDLVTYIDDQGSGKLYKCIVAIETPHAFNINEWDDVTASEAFVVTNNISITIAGSANKSFSDLLNELSNEIDFALLDRLIEKGVIPLLILNESNNITLANFIYHSSIYFEFERTTISGSYLTKDGITIMISGAGSSAQRYQCAAATNTWSNTTYNPADTSETTITFKAI